MPWLDLKKFDPEADFFTSDTEFYLIEEKLDRLLSDDVITIWGHDLQYLRSITYPNRLIKMIQRIGSEFYLEQSQKKPK